MLSGENGKNSKSGFRFFECECVFQALPVKTVGLSESAAEQPTKSVSRRLSLFSQFQCVFFRTLIRIRLLICPRLSLLGVPDVQRQCPEIVSILHSNLNLYTSFGLSLVLSRASNASSSRCCSIRLSVKNSHANAFP